MAKLLNDVSAKVDGFVKDREVFKKACAETFEAADASKDGKLSMRETVACVNHIFDKVEGALNEYGLKIQRPSKKEVQALYKAADKDQSQSLTPAEFEELYISVLKYASYKASTAVGKTYGLGILGGLLGFGLLKKLVKPAPVVGAIIGVVPTFLGGPVLGVAVTYGILHGDFARLRKRIMKKD